MPRYHITPSGDPKVCKAKPGGCLYGPAEEHYSSQRDARAAYEVIQASPAAMRKAVAMEGNPFADVPFPVFPIAGAQMLSQGSSRKPNELRLKSDSFNATNYTVAQAEAIGVSYFNGKCACGRKLFVKRNGNWVNVSPQHTDHVLSASAGHLAAAGNIQALCPRCNADIKNDRSFEHLYDVLAKEGTLTEEEAKLGKARTRAFVEGLYYGAFPEMRAFNEAGDTLPSRGSDLERYKAKVSILYADLTDADRLRPKTHAIYEGLYGNTEIWQTLDDVNAIMDALATDSEKTAKDVRARKHQLQMVWEEVVGRETSIKDIQKDDWKKINQTYLARYSKSNPLWDKGEGEYNKAKRALRVLAIIADRDDFEEHTRTLPGYAGFDHSREV